MYSFICYIVLGLVALGLTVLHGETNLARRSDTRATERRYKYVSTFSVDPGVCPATRFYKIVDP
jgi:hypothetical protein